MSINAMKIFEFFFYFEDLFYFLYLREFQSASKNLIILAIIIFNF
jgi:hypothetical protein